VPVIHTIIPASAGIQNSTTWTSARTGLTG